MKRAFDSSFVSSLDNTYTTTSTHSLHRRSAALATHPVYLPRDYNTQTYYLQQPLLAPTCYLTSGVEDDSDFQSNVWFQPTTSNTQYWTRLAPTRRPLTGLGISFGPLEGSSSSVPYVLHSEPILSPFFLPVDQVNSDQTAPQDVATKFPGNEDSGLKAAYSTCPDIEFVAHSPVNASQSSYSPVDDFLMLLDSPLTIRDVGSKGKAKVVDLDDDIPMLSLGSPQGPLVGLFADVNFRALAAQKTSPNIGINPERIICCSSTPPPRAEAEDMDMRLLLKSAAVGSPEVEAEFPEEAVSAIVSVLAKSVNREQPPASMISPDLHPQGFVTRRLIQPMSAVLPIPPPTFASRTTVGTQEPSFTRQPSLVPIIRAPLVPVQPRNLADHSELLTIERGSPILNAHEGVELEDLRARAETFRRMNPGCELDKAFLQSFAGRLSKRGELISEFRCYVKGCLQSNKRRDHILVHVGSHVEHRPFQCDEWCAAHFSYHFHSGLLITGGGVAA
jgi:hypothetical protein